MDPGKQNRITYLAPLDGIRAIAILAVVLFHIWPAAFSGGYTGVDVFFVLSGFLITSTVLYDIHEGCFSQKEFYIRRIQRLLPNVAITVLVVLLLWVLFMPQNASVQPGVHGIWTLFSLSNIYIWKNLGGYWGDEAEWSPMTHFWSLGVEEQFYFFFPSTLLLLTRFQPDRIRFWLTAATVTSFSVCLYGTYAHPIATFYLMPTRIWELLLGAILAVHRAPTHVLSAQLGFSVPIFPKAQEVIGWVGISMMVVSIFSIGESCAFPGLVSLAPTVGTVFVLLSVTTARETRVSRLLSTPLMVQIGKLSYSLYLWHWPLIIFGKIQADLYGFSQLAGATAGALIGLLMGWCAHVFVERPLRHRGPGRSRRLVIIATGSVIAVICCFVVAVRRVDADPSKVFATPKSSLMQFDVARYSTPPDFKAIHYSDVIFSPSPPYHGDPWRRGGVVHLYGGGHPKVVVIGSSQAVMYSKLIDDICRNLGLSVAHLGAGWSTPAFFEATVNPGFPSAKVAREFDEARKYFIHEWQPEMVFIADTWDRFVDLEEFDLKLKSFLRDVSPQVGRVFFVTQIPTINLRRTINLRSYALWRMDTQNHLPRFSPDPKEQMRKRQIAIAERLTTNFKKLRIIRADLPFYKKDGSIRYADERKFFYLDSNHLTNVGAEEVRFMFEKAIIERLN